MKRKCICGKPRRPSATVCPACWAATPQQLKDGIRAVAIRGTVEQRRAAVRAVLDHLNGTRSFL